MSKVKKTVAATLAAASLFGIGAGTSAAILYPKLHDAKKDNFETNFILHDKDMTIFSQTATIASLNKSIAELEEKLQNSNYDEEQVASLNAQIATLKEQVTKLESQKNAETEEYKQIIDLCNTQIETLTKAVETGSADLEAANTTINTLKNELKALKEQNDKLQNYVNNIDNVDSINNDINELKEYIASKDEHFAEDRAYVHNELDDLDDRIESLKTFGLLSHNEYYNLSYSITDINKKYIILNIENGLSKYKNADAYTLTQNATLNDSSLIQVSGYSNTQAFAYVNKYDNSNNLIGSNYGIIDNGISKIISDGKYQEEEFNAASVKAENLDGIVSSLKFDIYYPCKIEYVENADRYDIISESGGYNSPNSDDRTSNSYTFDENNDLVSYQQYYYSFNNPSNNFTTTVTFDTISLEEFSEKFNAVSTSLQEELAKLEQNQEEKE